MSETGIYAGGYQRVREYAEAVDNLLIELKAGHPPAEAVYQPVVDLLEALQKPVASAFVQTVGVLLRTKAVLPAARLKSIATELRSRQVSPSTIDGLESFAAALDEERAAISARLRGA